MKLSRSEKPGHLVLQFASGQTVTMHREDMVIQLEAFGYRPKKAFELICRAEDLYPVEVKDLSKKSTGES